VIRSLLAERPASALVSGAIAEAMPSREATPETYLGYQRLMGLANPAVAPDREAPYRLPKMLELGRLAYGGRWRVEPERAVARENARLRLRFRAKEVNLVLGGTGRVEVLLDGERVQTVRVRGSRLYNLLRLPRLRTGLLELRFERGVSGYAFTFG
jgi:Thioredoxin like C-terminal domain